MFYLLVAAEGEVAPRDGLEHVRRGSSRLPYPAVPGRSARERLDTSINLHARLMTAEREVAPRDVLEHVREVLDDGRAGLAPARALRR